MSHKRWMSAGVLMAAMSGWGCAGCGTPAAPPTGFLSIGIDLPVGTPGNVTVSGPSNFSKSLTQSTVLTVAPGAYTVTAANAFAPTPLAAPILYSATVSGSPATVQANAAVQVDVNYSAIPGTGNIWLSGLTVGDTFAALLGFAPFDPSPRFQVDSSRAPSLEAMALDTQGGIWVADDGRAQILRFSATQLASSIFVVPDVQIANNYDGGLKEDGGYNLVDPEGPAFDSQGNLWVADFNNNVLLKYANVASLSGLVVTEPTAIVTAASAQPWGLAFDSSGNLWVASRSAGQLVMYSNPSALTGSVSPSPAVILQNVSDGGTQAFSSPLGMAFDSQSNLWVANFDPPASIVKLIPSQLTASSEVQPVAQVIGSPILNPAALAFDQQGNLWVADNNLAYEFSASDIASATGIEALDAGWVFFYEDNAGGVLVDPTPTNLPLHH